MKSIFRNTLCPSYWFPPEVLSVADIFILSSLSVSRCLCWALLMSNIGPCNYPMYKQLTQSRYSDPGSQYWRSSPGHGPSLHLSLHCQIRTQRGEMVRCGPNWTLSGKVSQIYSYFDDLTELWLTAPAGSGEGPVPYNKMPISPLTAPR